MSANLLLPFAFHNLPVRGRLLRLSGLAQHVPALQEDSPCSQTLAELLAAEGSNLPILHLGLPDAFQHHASREDLLAEAGLDVAGIRAAVLQRWPHLTQTAGAARSA